MSTISVVHTSADTTIWQLMEKYVLRFRYTSALSPPNDLTLICVPSIAPITNGKFASLLLQFGVHRLSLGHEYSVRTISK